jgi:hypothetical protein
LTAWPVGGCAAGWVTAGAVPTDLAAGVARATIAGAPEELLPFAGDGMLACTGVRAGAAAWTLRALRAG